MSVLGMNLIGTPSKWWAGKPPSAGELAAFTGQNKIRIFAKKKDHPVMGTWFWSCDSVESLNQEGWDIYTILNHVNPDFVGIKPSDADMINQSFVLVDYDPTGEYITNMGMDKAANVLAGYQDCNLAMWTGNGFQVWYRFRDLSNDFPKARLETKALLGILKSSWEYHGPMVYKVDTCTTDISRLVRWPNTINWKTGQRGSVLNINSGRVITRPHVTLPPPQPPPAPLNKEFKNLSQLAPRLNATASKFLIEGLDNLEKSRHTAAYATAMNLKEIGLNEERARELVLGGAAKCTRGGKPFPLSEADALHAVRTAYKSK